MAMPRPDDNVPPGQNMASSDDWLPAALKFLTLAHLEVSTPTDSVPQGRVSTTVDATRSSLEIS